MTTELAALLDELAQDLYDRPQHAFSFADAAIRLGVTWLQGLPVERLLTDLEVADAFEYRNEAPEHSWPLPEPLGGHRLSRCAPGRFSHTARRGGGQGAGAVADSGIEGETGLTLPAVSR